MPPTLGWGVTDDIRGVGVVCVARMSANGSAREPGPTKRDTPLSLPRARVAPGLERKTVTIEPGDSLPENIAVLLPLGYGDGIPARSSVAPVQVAGAPRTGPRGGVHGPVRRRPRRGRRASARRRGGVLRAGRRREPTAQDWATAPARSPTRSWPGSAGGSAGGTSRSSRRVAGAAGAGRRWRWGRRRAAARGRRGAGGAANRRAEPGPARGTLSVRDPRARAAHGVGGRRPAAARRGRRARPCRRAGEPDPGLRARLRADLDCWHFQRAALRDRYRMVFYDQRSHGRSGRSSPPVARSTSSAGTSASCSRRCRPGRSC